MTYKIFLVLFSLSLITAGLIEAQADTIIIAPREPGYNFYQPYNTQHRTCRQRKH